MRAPDEPADPGIRAFYDRLLAVLRRDVVRTGTWSLLETRPAWDGNPTWDGFIAWHWQLGDEECSSPSTTRRIRASATSPCPRADRGRGLVRLVDLMGPAVYDRDGVDIAAHGLYLDVPPWGYHAFEIRR